MFVCLRPYLNFPLFYTQNPPFFPTPPPARILSPRHPSALALRPPPRNHPTRTRGRRTLNIPKARSKGRADGLQRRRQRALINTENWDKSPGSGLSAPLFGERDRRKRKRQREIERRGNKLMKPGEAARRRPARGEEEQTGREARDAERSVGKSKVSELPMSLPAPPPAPDAPVPPHCARTLTLPTLGLRINTYNYSAS